MTEMIDRLIFESTRPDMVTDLSSAVVFDVTNVSNYYWMGTGQEAWDIHHDFPNIAPPYSAFWMEYKLPEYIVSDVFGVQKADFGPISRFGTYWVTQTIHDPDNDTKIAGWSVEVICWYEMGKHQPMFNLGAMSFPVDKDGHWLNFNDGNAWRVVTPSEASVRNACLRLNIPIPNPWPANPTLKQVEALQDAQHTSSEAMIDMIRPMLLALSFMHCKNVTITQERPPDWQQKAAIKKHKRTLVTYRVLNIEPMKTVLKTEGDIEHNGLKKALHICRGHFKTYSADKPLFGRVTGTYWWQPHVRGSLDEGVALKDYNVKAPKSS